MRKTIFITLIYLLIESFSFSVSSFAENQTQDEMNAVLKTFLPPNAQLVYPEAPKGTKSYQFYDFDQDGQNELIVTFKMKAADQPNPSQYGVILLRKNKEGWEKVWETQTQGVGLPYSGFADLTGDGKKEFLFGIAIGASAGNQLQIYHYHGHALKKIAEIPYHMLELLGNDKVSLAVWQRYIANTYFVDVLMWDGKKFVFNEERFASYYPVIENFYKNKIGAMDAWFYWYTLADAQIKANLFERAAESIQRGIALAQQKQLPDEIENFHKLKEKLEGKR